MAYHLTIVLFVLIVASAISGTSSQEITVEPYLDRADQRQNVTLQSAQTSSIGSADRLTPMTETSSVMVVAIKTDAPEAEARHFQAALKNEFGDGLECAEDSDGLPMYCRAAMKINQIRKIAKSTQIYSALFPDATFTVQNEVMWEDGFKTISEVATGVATPVNGTESSRTDYEKNGANLVDDLVQGSSKSRRSAEFHKRALEVQLDSPIELKVISHKKQELGNFSDYSFDSSAGQNVTVYYISLGDASDCIASKVSSRDFGIAKLANVTAVTVSKWATPVDGEDQADDSDNGEVNHRSSSESNSSSSTDDDDGGQNGEADIGTDNSDDAEEDDSDNGDDANGSQDNSTGSNHDSSLPSDDKYDDSSVNDPPLLTQRSASPSAPSTTNITNAITLSDFGYMLSSIATSIAASGTQGYAVVHIGPGLHIDANSYTALAWLKARLLALAALDVPIVVASGDAGSARPVDAYPALFAPDVPQMLVVGAADAASGAAAAFSQGARGDALVRVFAPGTAVRVRCPAAAGSAAPGPVRAAAGSAVASAQVAGLAAYFLALPGSGIPPLGAGGRALWVREAIEQAAYERVPGGPRIIYNGL